MYVSLYEIFMLSFVLLMVYRCVSADAVPLMRDDIVHGDGDNIVVAGADTMLEIPFDAFAFMGSSNKLFLSCVMCLNNCEMVSDMYMTVLSNSISICIHVGPLFTPLSYRHRFLKLCTLV